MRADKTWCGPLLEPSFRFPTANATLVVALFVAAAARLGPALTEALIMIVVALASVAVSVRLGSCIGVVGWAFYTGFVEHRYGVLTFAGEDLVRLAVLAAVGALLATSTSRPRPAPKRIWSVP